MSTGAGKHRGLIDALRIGQGKNDGAFEKAATAAFEYVFEHLDGLNDHVLPGVPDSKDTPLKSGEPPTLRQACEWSGGHQPFADQAPATAGCFV